MATAKEHLEKWDMESGIRMEHQCSAEHDWVLGWGSDDEARFQLVTRWWPSVQMLKEKKREEKRGRGWRDEGG